MNAAEENTTDWPAGNRPIFTDDGFGTVRRTDPTPDALGELPSLSVVGDLVTAAD